MYLFGVKWALTTSRLVSISVQMKFSDKHSDLFTWESPPPTHTLYLSHRVILFHPRPFQMESPSSLVDLDTQKVPGVAKCSPPPLIEKNYSDFTRPQSLYHSGNDDSLLHMGYWSSVRSLRWLDIGQAFFFACLWTEMESRSIHSRETQVNI